MTIRTLLLLVLLPLVGGCIKGEDLQPALAARQTLAPTVRSFEDMEFKAVPELTNNYGTFAVGDPVFDFGEDGLSYFRAFALPVSKKPYILEATSDRVQYNCAPCTLGIVRPDVLLLDAEKKPLPKIEWPEPYIDISAGKTRRYMTATITPEMGARYAVLYAPRKYIGQEEVGWVQMGHANFASADTILPIPLRPRYWATGTPIGPMGFVLRDVGSERR